jgi:hypothetical protein
VRFLGFDSEKNHNLIEWCCDKAHNAYRKAGLGVEEEGWCIYCVPELRDRDKNSLVRFAKNYILYIDYCPFCSAKAEDSSP